MKTNRRNVTIGLAGLGLVGILAGGVGVAAAATETAGTPNPQPTTSACPFGGARGMGYGLHRMADAENTPFTAAASYLGLSQDALREQMRDGKSLADIAKARSKSVSGLKDAMVAAVKKNLDADTTLTADQKAAILARITSRIDQMINTAHTPGAGFGRRGGPMRGFAR